MHCAEKGISLCFPIFAKKSLEFKEGLQNAIERTLPYCKLEVIFKSSFKFVNHFHFKHVLPKIRCSGILYSFKCNSCNVIYHGKTKRHFQKSSEQLNIRKFCTWQTKQSASLEDLLTCDCNINFNNSILLSKDSINTNLLIKKSSLIARDKLI